MPRKNLIKKPRRIALFLKKLRDLKPSRLLWLLLVFSLTGGSMTFLLGARVLGPHPKQAEEETGDDPLLREDWFLRNRISPNNEPAASHRYRAALLARQMRGITAGGNGLNRAQNRMARPDNIPGGGGADWQEAGPNPLVLNSTLNDGTPPKGNLSGRVSYLLLDPNDKTNNTLYVGTAYGGVWKTTTALGSSPQFTSVSDPNQTLAVGAIAVDPTSSNNLYVGTGEGNESGLSYYGLGILVTKNGGTTWGLVSTANGPSGPVSLLGLTFARILVDPKNPNVVLAGGQWLNLRYSTGGLSPSYGLYRSTDGGASWNYVTTGITGTSFAGHPCSDIAFDPTVGGSLGTYYAGFRGLGVYKSTDQGQSWTQLSSPFPSKTAPTNNILSRISLAAKNGTLYALICSDQFVNSGADPLVPNPGGPSTPNTSLDTGLSQSTDGGNTWTAISLPSDAGIGWYRLYIAVPPGGGLATGGLDVWSTATVNGKNTAWNHDSVWTQAQSVHADQHAIAFADATHWFVGCDGGVWSTANGTSTSPTWANLNNGLRTIQYISVSPDIANSGVFFGGAQDNGTQKNTSGSQTWNQVVGGDGGFTDTNPVNSTQYFSEGATLAFYVNNNSGSIPSWTQISPSVSDQNAFYAPYKVLPSATNPVLLMGTTRLLVGNANGGWTPEPSNFPGNTNGNFFVPNVPGNFIQAVEAAPATTSPEAIYVSTTQRYDTSDNIMPNPIYKIFKTTDFKNWNWTDITGPLPSRAFSCIASDPTNPSFVYVSATGFNTGHVFFSYDAGKDWVDITGDLPDAPVNWITIDPRTPSQVYAATDVGVFVTQNGGVHWDKLGNVLPDTVIQQVKISPESPRSLVAATHGRGAWTITPLSGDPPCFNPVSFFTGSGGTFNQLTGITGGPNSPFLYAVEGGNKRIDKFTVTGTNFTSFAPGGSNAFGLPVRVAADGQDNVYVTDIINNLVDVFDSNGNFLFSFDGSSSGKKFNNPIGITVDQQGDVFVVDTSNNRVVEFKVNVGARSNSFVATIGSAGTGNGQFVQPTGVAVDASGAFLYVSDTTPRVQKFDAKAHNFITDWNLVPGPFANPNLNGPAGVNASDLQVGKDGNLYADVVKLTVQTVNGLQKSVEDFNIQVFDPNGNYLSQMGSSGTGLGQSGGFGGPAFDNCGNVYASDSQNNRVVIFSPCGGGCQATTAFRTLSIVIHMNTVGGPAQGAVMTENLPAGTSFVSSSITPASVNGSLVTWNLGSLPPGTTDVTLTVSVNAATGTQIVNLPVVTTTSGSVATLVDPFNVVAGVPPTATATPTPCLARVASPNLDLRIKRIQCNNNLVAYRVFVQDNDSVPVKLSDLTVKLWAFDTGITQWQLDNNFSGLLFGNGVNGQTVNGALGMKALPFTPACNTDPSHQANWEFDVSPTSSMAIPAGGGYWISGDFGIHPVNFNPPFNPGLSSWFSQAPGGVCGGTGSSNDPSTYYDDPHYALYFQGQLVAEKAGSDPNTGTVPCALLCPPPPTATPTPTVPCTPVAGQPSPNLDLKVRLIQCNTGDQAVYRVFVRNNDPSVQVKLSDLILKIWAYDTTAAGFKLNNYFNGNLNGNIFNGNGSLFQGVTGPFQVTSTAMPQACLSNPGHLANFELDVTNSSSQVIPANGGYFIDGDFGIQRTDGAAFVPGLSSWYSQIPAGEGNSCSDIPGNDPAGYFDDAHYALFYQGNLVAEQGGADANTGLQPCVCQIPMPNASGQTLTAKAQTASPTATISPTQTPVARDNGVVAAPNISRNGEPVTFLINLEKPSQITLKLFTVSGEQAYSASTQGETGANSLVWNLGNQLGQPVASGLYLYEAEINDGTSTFRRSGKVAVLH